jgi:MYXO-CTERM domain-containing protein
MITQKILRTAVSALVVSVASAGWAVADSIDLPFDTVISGSTPAGGSPWLNATLDQSAPSSVKLTIAADGLVGSEFLSSITFSLDHAIDLSQVSLSHLAAEDVGSFAVESYDIDENAFNGISGHRYDIQMTFGKSNKGNGAERLGAGEAVSFQFDYVAGALSIWDFVVPADRQDGTEGIYYNEAHVQSINGEYSSKITDTPPSPGVSLPIPAAAPAGLLGLALLAGRRRGSIR